MAIYWILRNSNDELERIAKNLCLRARWTCPQNNYSSSKLTKLGSTEMTDQEWSLTNFHYWSYDWSEEWEVNRYLAIVISLIDALAHASMQSMQSMQSILALSRGKKTQLWDLFAYFKVRTYEYPLPSCLLPFCPPFGYMGLGWIGCGCGGEHLFIFCIALWWVRPKTNISQYCMHPRYMTCQLLRWTGGHCTAGS